MSRIPFWAPTFAVLLSVPALAQDAQPIPAKVEEIFSRMAQAGPEQVWDHALALEDLGSEAAEEIARRLETSPSHVKLAGAKVVEYWVQADNLGLMQQLGVVPPPGG